ncbi:MAG TPA: aldo/keto reductase [Bellilinea sp.]|nr:aldo/keto reductase [Bellilinea sp.]
MNYKLLGNTGVKVSGLCFGTMSFGGDADEAASAAMYRRCREAGINFFDCANIYADGRSETILGKLIASERDELVITSKFFYPTGPGMNERGASRRNIMLAVEDSLRRLQTDRLDVYFIHHFDETVPLEETLRAFNDLVLAGKILYPAASNFAAWQVMKGLGISDHRGWARFEVLQPMYNLVKRQAEVELFPLAEAENLAVIPYSPLGGGLLTGKYSTKTAPGAGRLVDNKMYTARYSEAGTYETAEAFVSFAKENGYEPAALAVAWAAGHPAVTAPILGARSVQQLEGSLAAAKINLTPELRAEISALSYTPPPATDRYEERNPIDYYAKK